MIEIFFYLAIYLLLFLSCIFNKFDFTTFQRRFKIFFRIAGLLYMISIIALLCSKYLLVSIGVISLIIYLVVPYCLVAISFYIVVHYRKNWDNINYWLSILTEVSGIIAIGVTIMGFLYNAM